MARFMNGHIGHQARIQKLVHLGVVRENQTLLSKTTPVANADCDNSLKYQSKWKRAD